MLDGIYCAHQFHVFDFNLSCLLRKFIYRMIVKPVAKLRPTYIINLVVFVSLYSRCQQKVGLDFGSEDNQNDSTCKEKLFKSLTPFINFSKPDFLIICEKRV